MYAYIICCRKQNMEITTGRPGRVGSDLQAQLERVRRRSETSSEIETLRPISLSPSPSTAVRRLLCPAGPFRARPSTFWSAPDCPPRSGRWCPPRETCRRRLCRSAICRTSARPLRILRGITSATGTPWPAKHAATVRHSSLQCTRSRRLADCL